jgi:pectinesterase
MVAKPPSRVDGRFVPPREDYAWENDRIAFRMYGPALAKEVNNGIDVWTKRVRYLVVEKWYKASEGGKDAYHEDHGEGADFFNVGRSLGAGGCGIWKGDSVNQPGVFSSYKTICNGPIRLTFELTYTNWKIGEKKFTEHMRISLDAGQNLNAVQVAFEGLDANEPLQLACGLVKRSNTKIQTNEGNCWMALWGLTTSDTVNGSLGTGAVLPKSTIVKFTEDKDQYLVIVNAKAGTPFSYYAGAGWTRNGDFPTVNDWNSYLDSFSRRLQSPLKITITGGN